MSIDARMIETGLAIDRKKTVGQPFKADEIYSNPIHDLNNFRRFCGDAQMLADLFKSPSFWIGLVIAVGSVALILKIG